MASMLIGFRRREQRAAYPALSTGEKRKTNGQQPVAPGAEKRPPKAGEGDFGGVLFLAFDKDPVRGTFVRLGKAE